MSIRLVLPAVAIIALPGTALAQWAPANGYVSSNPSRAAIDLRFTGELEALRHEALVLRQSDGGTLTAEHRAELQAKLDRLQVSYRRTLQRYDPWSVNADGSARY